MTVAFGAGGNASPAENSRKPPATWGATFGVAAVALLMRLWFIAETRGVPAFRTPGPGSDIDLHLQAAREIRRGMVPHFALMEMSAPLHAFVLAIEQSLVGESMLRLRLVAAPVGALTAALIHRVAFARTRSRWAAIGVGLMAAFLPSLIYFDTMLLKVSLEILLLASILAVVSALQEISGTRRRVAFGVALGLLLATLCLSQRNALVEIGTLMLFLATDRSSATRQRLATLVPAAAILAACLGIFAMRDRLGPSTAHTFLPQAGIHFREGFRPDRVGPSNVPGIASVGRDHVFMTRILGEQELGRPLTPSETDAHQIAVGLRSIAEHPYMAAMTLGAKVLLFWNDAEQKVHANSFRLLCSVAWALRAPVGFGTLAVLASLGVVKLFETRASRVLWLPCGLVAAVFVVNMLGLVTARYRLHAVVPMLLLSGSGMVLVVERLRSRVLRRAWVPLAVALAAAAVAYGPLPAEVRTTPTPLELMDGQSLHTEAKLVELASLDGTDEEASLHRIRLLIALRRDSEAFAMLTPLVGGPHPVDLWAARTWLDYLLLLGEYDQAGAFIDRMNRRDPNLGARLLYGRQAPLQWVLDVLVLHRPSTAGT
ncbi:MAG: hypothetical protein ACLP1X_19500 [Polyangiaceae bacterium]